MASVFCDGPRTRGRRMQLRVSPEPRNAVTRGEAFPRPTDHFIGAGWLMSEMDKAAGRRAYRYIGGPSVTVGIDDMSFTRPVMVGDEVEVYTSIVRQGEKSSLTIRVECIAERLRTNIREKVTEGLFTFSAIGPDGRPVKISGRPFGPQIIKKAGYVESLARPGGADLVFSLVPDANDINYQGNIFGGWILDRMDKACARRARDVYGTRYMATRAVEAMTFKKALYIGDAVDFYARPVKTGRTSVTMNVEAWATRAANGTIEKVTEGTFTYVGLDENRKPVVLAQTS